MRHPVGTAASSATGRRHGQRVPSFAARSARGSHRLRRRRSTPAAAPRRLPPSSTPLLPPPSPPTPPSSQRPSPALPQPDASPPPPPPPPPSTRAGPTASRRRRRTAVDPFPAWTSAVGGGSLPHSPPPACPSPSDAPPSPPVGGWWVAGTPSRPPLRRFSATDPSPLPFALPPDNWLYTPARAATAAGPGVGADATAGLAAVSDRHQRLAIAAGADDRISTLDG